MWVIQETGDSSRWCLFWSEKVGLIQKRKSNSLQWSLSLVEVFGVEDGIEKMLLFTKLLDVYDTSAWYDEEKACERDELELSLRFSTSQLTDPRQTTDCLHTLISSAVKWKHKASTATIFSWDGTRKSVISTVQWKLTDTKECTEKVY